MDTRQQKNPEASTDEWYTPRWIIDLLGPFDTDPCSPVVPPYEIAPISYTKEQDGLTHDWQGVVWMNPPYSRKPLRQFCEKMARHSNGLEFQNGLVKKRDITEVMPCGALDYYRKDAVRDAKRECIAALERVMAQYETSKANINTIVSAFRKEIKED